MTRPTRIEVCTGGEASLGLEPCGKCGIPVEVELTDAEIAQLEADQVAFAARKAEEEAALAAAEAAKASAQAKLAALGLTAEEIAALSK